MITEVDIVFARKQGFMEGYRAATEVKKRNQETGKDGRSAVQQAILETCQKYFEITFSELSCSSRKREFLLARQITIYFLYQYGNMYLTEIGALFQRDHTTILHSKSRVYDMLYTKDPLYAVAVAAISETLQPIIKAMFPKNIRRNSLSTTETPSSLYSAVGCVRM